MSESTDLASSSSPQRKKARLDNATPSSSQAEPANSCPICLDSWSSTGTHRLVSLKCGHLFGQLCIEKWLSTRYTCPQCNGSSKKSDIRPIYAKVICAVDNDERDDALRLLETEKTKRNHLEKLHLKTSMQCQMFASENSFMKKTIMELENRLKASEHMRSTISAISGHGCYSFSKSVFASAEKKAHIFHSDPFSGLIAVSKKFEDTLNQYGVLKISSIDSCHHEFVGLHLNQIRDVAFDPHGNTTLLSCSKNKDIKLTCMKSNNTVITYQATKDCWSCSWSLANSYHIYCGLQNGEVMMFDIRNTKEVIESICPTNGPQKCPIVSVVSIPSPAENGKEGLLVSTLQCITYYKRDTKNKFVGDLLETPTGALSSVSFEHDRSQILASYKPNTKYPKERHILMNLSFEEKTVANVVSTFEGGTNQHLRSRSCLIKCPDNDNHLLVCAGDQSTNTVRIWSTTDMQQLQSWDCRKEDGPIIAMGPHRAAGVNFICALTNQRLNQYKWLYSKSHFSEASQAFST
ncbi:E3 ubiquitin-protein ligase RFWD3-like [Bolinopsis microptera]|uniref:E3 ubiquitin-protein ligase RFWD3-like n=1 Tax=Bolinopsis microptera TaxID=2820187 RepID=UPI003079C9C2